LILPAKYDILSFIEAIHCPTGPFLEQFDPVSIFHRKIASPLEDAPFFSPTDSQNLTIDLGSNFELVTIVYSIYLTPPYFGLFKIRD
jgi:hypothetical protein